MLVPFAFSSKPAGRPRGFTLVELLVVIAIIGVLVALLLPAVQAAREAANRMQCSNNMKQMGLATHNFHDTYRRFPPGSLATTATPPAGVTGDHQYLSALYFILPYMEQTNVYDQVDAAVDTNIDHFPGITYPGTTKPIQAWWANGTTWSAAQTKISAYECPSQSPYDSSQLLAYTFTNGLGITRAWFAAPYTEIGRTSYGPCAGGIGQAHTDPAGWGLYKGIFWPRSKNKMASVTDGTSNTIMYGEVMGHCLDTNKNVLEQGYAWIGIGAVPTGWYLPKPISQPRYLQNGSRHPGGAMFCLADGSVNMISSTVDNNMFLYTSGMGDGRTTQGVFP